MRHPSRPRAARLSVEHLEERDTPAVAFTIDPAANLQPISRFIYGTNTVAPAAAGHTLERLGGNRWTAYNWETNASNAGSDWYFQNDSYLGGGTAPGGAVAPTLQRTADRNQAALVTVPINGYVAADKNADGDVRNSGPSYLQTRFKPLDPTKGAAFSLTPDTADGYVYADEFVNWVNTTYPNRQTDPTKPIWFSLDNEPDLWRSTHAAVHPNPVTYAELVQKTTDYASAIKAVAPGSLVFGPVSYGWNGFTTLQDAPDAAGRDFLNFYLAQMKAAGQTAGRRLVDALDLHWYPEAQGGGVRITEQNNSAAVVAARLQAPRSLWDPTYTETSWITQWSTGGPIDLINRMEGKIAAHYPGTKLAVTEYNYGGGDHISGGIAQADVLGVFGREGVYAASQWQLYASEPFVAGAFAMFRNFDGAGGTFGDTSVSATTTNTADSSVYASVDSADPNVLVVVAINKTAAALPATLDLKGVPAGSAAKFYTLTSASSSPQAAGQATVNTPSAFATTLPAYSVTTIRITRAADTTPPAVSVGDVTVAEGDAGTTAARFAVTLSKAATAPVTVRWATADGTATVANADYQAAGGTVTFAPGQTVQTVTVLVAGDARTEGNETFAVRLSAPAGATLGDADGRGTIRNDDAPAVRVANIRRTEGNAGTSTATFTLTLSAPTTKTVTVAFGTADGTARAGSDYTARAGTVTFAPGETAKAVYVAVLGDTRVEGDETFRLNLSGPTNATLAVAQATATIADDDRAGAVAVTWVKREVWASGFTMDVTIKNNGPTAVAGWTLEFDLDGEIANLWSGVIVSRVGNRYTVRNESWNGSVAANGGTVGFGFVADPAAAGAVPLNLVFNGVPV